MTASTSNAATPAELLQQGAMLLPNRRILQNGLWSYLDGRAFSMTRLTATQLCQTLLDNVKLGVCLCLGGAAEGELHAQYCGIDACNVLLPFLL